ncbi:MAG: GNAT family N-acetyltransferase [Alphaproteobacteria bacterium]
MSNWKLRPARADDLPKLSQIEKAADKLLIEAGMDLPPAQYSDDAYGADDDIIVAALTDRDEPVGFAYVIQMEQGTHLAELGVDPAHGRQGIGAALVQHILKRAEADGQFAVTLSTFIHVPFNGPFYEKLGFEAVSPLSLGTEYPKLRQAEADNGLDVSQRQFMIRYLNPVSRNEAANN